MNAVDEAGEEAANGLTSVISPFFIQTPWFCAQQSVLSFPQQMLLSAYSVRSSSVQFSG